MFSAEYLAGFFDGEGWITVGSSGRKQGNICVGICNCDRTIIEMIRVQFPNCYFRIRNGIGNANTNYSLQWSGLECVQLLEFILPHLHIKRGAATFGVELARLQSPRGKKPRVSSAMNQKRQELGSKIYLLTKRGA